MFPVMIVMRILTCTNSKDYISFAESNTEQSPVDMTHENSESFK